ncbi:MAG: biopolymer transporter ExbD [Thermoguttaceae bacterium]|nr:biopolymer transporter ExbD [Thermoguttaceae bacterium]
MSKRRVARKSEKTELQMTSMIDVVFLLLAFFVITYKTPEVEGDFGIRMPVEAQSNQAPTLDELTPVVVRLTADSRGELSGIRFGDAALGDMNALRSAVYRYINQNGVAFSDAYSGAGTPEFRDDLEIELDCDPALRYRYAVQAITAVAGYLNSEGQIVKMVDKVKFAPPKN